MRNISYVIYTIHVNKYLLTHNHASHYLNGMSCIAFLYHTSYLMKISGINMHFIMSFDYISYMVFLKKYIIFSSSYHVNKCFLRHMHYISCRFFS